MTQGRLSYDLRRLRLHGLITRIDGTHRYTVTDHGLRLAIYLTRVHNRLLADGLSDLLDPATTPTPIRRHLDRSTHAVDANIRQHRLIA